MKNKFFYALSVVFCTFALSVSSTTAQTINGAVNGQVTDQSGDAVAGATVTARNIDTGLTREATTNEEGNYRIYPLQIGGYTVSVTAPGFEPRTIERLDVTTAVDAKADLQLGVQGTQAEVTVTASGALLETSQSQVSKSVDRTRILELPGRNSLNGLALLNPGVLPSQNNRPGSGFAVNGNRTRSNNFTIDGANNNDQSLATPRQNLPPEALAEFQIITNTFSAEFGRNAGSYVNQITQSGTNDFHGIGFYSWGGNGVDALTTSQERAYNANRARGLSDYEALRLARSVTNDSTYGFTLGGPVKRNHTFFFTSLDYNDFRSTVGSATRAALSPAAITNLNANSARFAPGALQFLLSNFPVANDPTTNGSLTIRDPAVTCPTATPNCNVLTTVPLLTFNRGAAGGITNLTDSERFLIKLNTRINDKDNLSVRYLINRFRGPFAQTGITSLPGQEVGQNSLDQSLTINDAYSISSNFINEARATYSRRSIQFPEDLGIAFSIGGTGAFTIGNVNFPQSRLDNVFEFTDNVSYLTGNHSLKFGYNILRYDLDSFFAPNLNGTLSYPSLQDFLFDTSASVSRFAGTGQVRAITYEHSFFAQDDWRIRPDLTLNLGLRYEYTTAPFGFFANASPDVNNFAPRVGLAYNPKEFADGRFVFRAGYGISYDQVFQNILLNNSRNFPRGVNVAFPPANGTRPYDNFISPPGPEDYQRVTGLNPNFLPQRLFSPNERIRQPMSQQVTIGAQYQFGNDFVFKADYIMTKGSNLVREVETNIGFCRSGRSLAPGPENPLTRFGTFCDRERVGAAANSAFAETVAQYETRLNRERTDPTQGSITVSQGLANSIYHAGQFTLEKRFSNFEILGQGFGGVLFNANYTYSSFISESDDILGGQANRTLPADPRNPQLDRGRSAFDQPHRFVMSGVYSSPEVFRDNGFLNRLFSGYELAPVITLASGTPYSVINSNNALGILPGAVATVEGSQRVSVNPGGQFPLVSTPTAPNPNAYFIVNGTGSATLGTLGANTLRTGGTINANISAVKNFKTFGEDQRLQFRVEVFNLFNRRNFTTIPANTIGNTVNTTTFLDFGQTNIGGRGFTFGARYFF